MITHRKYNIIFGTVNVYIYVYQLLKVDIVTQLYTNSQ